MIKYVNSKGEEVAPLVGAWIEICYHRRYTTSDYFVAPLVGAWIEIIVTPRTQSDGWSLPLWERGLKSQICMDKECKKRSLPLWERGLKYLL